MGGSVLKQENHIQHQMFLSSQGKMIIQCMADCFTPLQRWLILRKIFHFSSNLQKKRGRITIPEHVPFRQILLRMHFRPTYLQLKLWQCFSLIVVQLEGNHCRKPHCCNGVVDTFGHYPGAWHLAFGELNQSERCSEIKSSLSMFYG